MVNIECTRCGATGTDYPTYYVAKFSLVHETGCGARVGIPKYSDGKPLPLLEETAVISEKKVSQKKKTSKKKKVEIVEAL